jgi:hypothetical protein
VISAIGTPTRGVDRRSTGLLSVRGLLELGLELFVVQLPSDRGLLVGHAGVLGGRRGSFMRAVVRGRHLLKGRPLLVDDSGLLGAGLVLRWHGPCPTLRPRSACRGADPAPAAK